MHPINAVPFILMFEYETKTWSKIHLNLPPNRIYYQFHIDENAILNVTTYSKVDENSEETLELRVASIRVPFKKPDSLINLCWFQVRDSGFSNKHLKNLI